jgi:hypothetical protein
VVYSPSSGSSSNVLVGAPRSIRGRSEDPRSRVLGTNSVPTFIWKPNSTPNNAINHQHAMRDHIRTRDDRTKFKFTRFTIVL